MEFLRAGEALLRSSRPLFPFLAPSAHRSSASIGGLSRRSRPQQLQCLASRPFATSSPRWQQNAAERPQEENEQEAAPPASPSADQTTDLLESALDQDKGVPGVSQGRTSRFKSPLAQQANRASTNPLERKNSTDEVSDLVTPSGATSRANDTTDSLDDSINSMLTLGESFATKSSEKHSGPPPTPPVLEPAPMKLNSTVGRTIRVDTLRNADVARAFRLLDQRIAQNNVRRDANKQRFHERPGLKKKRLKSERWRRRFKDTFKQTVTMVQKMKAQGW